MSTAETRSRETPSPSGTSQAHDRSLPAEEAEAQEKLKREFSEKEQDLGQAKEQVDRSRK